MQWKNQADAFGLASIILHWVSALMVFSLFGVGFYMVTLGYYDPLYRELPDLHKSFGSLFALLLVSRLAWRALNPPPAPIGRFAWEVRIAHVVHSLLYLLMFALIISGYLISTADGRALEIFGWLSLPATLTLEGQEDLAGNVHQYVAYGLMGLVSLHALAALKHHFVDKDRTLSRMLKP